MLEGELVTRLHVALTSLSETPLLKWFLEAVEISFLNNELKDARIETNRVQKCLYNKQLLKKEIDMVIELDSLLVYIQAKRPNNKITKHEVKTSYRIGSTIATKNKKEFYLVILDAKISEQHEISAVRNNRKESISKEKIKWINWYNVERIFYRFFSEYDFESNESRRYFEPMWIYFHERFKTFLMFDKDNLNYVSKKSKFLIEFGELLNDIAMFEQEMVVLLEKDGIKRISNKHMKRSKMDYFDIKTYRGWETMNHVVAGITALIPTSYTFKYMDQDWLNEERNNPNHYLYIRVDFLKKHIYTGFSLIVNDENEDQRMRIKGLFKFVKKNFALNGTSLNVKFLDILGNSQEMIASKIDDDFIEGVGECIEIRLYYRLKMEDEQILKHTKECLQFLRDCANDVLLHNSK